MLLGPGFWGFPEQRIGPLLASNIRSPLQEESEALYQAAFPDHFEAFADLATMEGEVVPADLEEAGTRPKGKAFAPQLMH